MAQDILGKMCQEFSAKYPRSAYAAITQASVQSHPNPLPYPELKEYIKKYQDPTQASSLAKIQKELDDTSAILHKTFENLLERGEKIDNLVAKSDVLSSQSKMFYTQV